MNNLENIQKFEARTQFTKDDAENIATALRSEKDRWQVKSKLESKFLDNAKNNQKIALTTATIEALKAKWSNEVNTVITKLSNNETANRTSDQRNIAGLLALYDLLTWGKGLATDIVSKKDTEYKTILTPIAPQEQSAEGTPAQTTINWAEIITIKEDQKNKLQWKVNAKTATWPDNKNITFWPNETIVTTKSTVETHYVEKDGNMYKITESGNSVALVYDQQATQDAKRNKQIVDATTGSNAVHPATENERAEDLQKKADTKVETSEATQPQTMEINWKNITINKTNIPEWLTLNINWTKIKLPNVERDMTIEQDKTQTKLVTHSDKSYNITPEINDNTISFKIKEVYEQKAKDLLSKEKWSNNLTIYDQITSMNNAFDKIFDKIRNNKEMQNDLKPIVEEYIQTRDKNIEYITQKYFSNSSESFKKAFEPLWSSTWISKDVLIKNGTLTNIGNWVREYYANIDTAWTIMLKDVINILKKYNNQNEYDQSVDTCTKVTESIAILSDYMRSEKWFINIIDNSSKNNISWDEFYKNTTNINNTIQVIPNKLWKFFQSETEATTAVKKIENLQTVTILKDTQESITTITNNMKPYPLPWTNPPELFYFHPQQILDQWFATKTWENISLIPNKDQLLREAINDKKLTAISVSSLVSKLYENPNIHILPWEKDDRRDESDADQIGFLKNFATWKVWTLDKKIRILDPNQIGTELKELKYNTTPENINIIKNQPARTLTTSAIEKANQKLPIIKVKVGATESYITRDQYNKLAGLDKWNRVNKNIATNNRQEQTALQTDTVKLFAQKYNISWTNIQPNWDRWIKIVPDTKEGNNTYNWVTIYVDKDLKLYGNWINTKKPIQCTPENIWTRINAMKKISTIIRQSQDRVNDKKNKPSDTQRGQLAFLQTYAKQLITGEKLPSNSTNPPAIAGKESYWLSTDIDFTNGIDMNNFSFTDIDKSFANTKDFITYKQNNIVMNYEQNDIENRNTA
jgi:hypothetical protein